MKPSFWSRALAGFWFAAVSLGALQAGAVGPADFGRTGPYLMLGGGYSFENFSNVGPVNIDGSPNLVFNAGWRLHPHVAVDVGFEWNSGFDASFAGINAEVDTYLTTVGMKFYALKGRIQPFIHPSVGVIVGKLDGNGFGSETSTTGALRGGGGIDVYVTENLFISVSAYYVYPIDTDLEDVQYIPLSAAVGWRF